MPRWHQTLVIISLLIFSTILVVAQDSNARVINMFEQLNVRSAPDNDAAVIGDLGGRTPVIVTGRDTTNGWYQITTVTGNISGWVSSGFIELRTISREDIPFIFEPASAPVAAPAQAPVPETNTAGNTIENTAPAGIPPVNLSAPNARIAVSLLNVRASDNTSAPVVARLDGGTVIQVLARNMDSTWVQIQLEGTTGWVFVPLILISVDVPSLPVASPGQVAPSAPASAPENEVSTTVAIPAGEAPFFAPGASAWNIFAQGQVAGNRANVFSKIGDSITVDEQAFKPFGFGVYDLGSYGYLQPTIDFYLAPARNNNSFNNTSLAARGGYNTEHLLNPANANPQLCNPGETPIACEYRLTKPAIALILVGTNDTIFVPLEQYANNLNVIVDYTIGQGIIPVLFTIPPRIGFPGRAEAYNDIITRIAQGRGLPLVDLYSAIVSTPGGGMDNDGIHPSSPPLRFEQAGNFTGDNLNYGYTVRNLVTLQALHVLRTSVLQ